MLFDADTPIDLIQAVRPDVLVKCADYAKGAVVGADLVESNGGTVALAPLAPGRSTTDVIRRILAAHGGDAPPAVAPKTDAPTADDDDVAPLTADREVLATGGNTDHQGM